MEITDVRVRLVEDSKDRLKAVCSVTFDGEFVVRDVKIVEGSNGLFVAMPSRKISSGCPKCRAQNPLRARFCNDCGAKLPATSIPVDSNGREKAHRDVAHPITPAFRQTLQDEVLEAYRVAYDEGGEPSDDTSFAAEEPAERRDEEREERAPREERESVEDAEPVEAASGSSRNEYDELIADLRGGGKRSESSDRGSGAQRSRDESRGRDEQRRGRRGGKPRQDSKRPPAREGRSGGSARSERPVRSERAEQSAPPPKETDSFGAGLSHSAPAREKPAAVQSDRVDLKKEAEVVETEAHPEDSTPFGAGL